jgi:DNA helicase-2/ATP-dependent DNA helicase PcrA
LCVPLKFMLTQQPRDGDAHVYGARSRFVSEKLLKTMEETTYRGSSLNDDLTVAQEVSVDVGSKLQSMW